jgi:hypothetical protein
MVRVATLRVKEKLEGIPSVILAYDPFLLTSDHSYEGHPTITAAAATETASGG